MSEGNGWNALFYNNHDQPRALNRFVDVKRFRNEGATMLAASIHLSRGTPYIYMGEEIGMLDPDYSSMDDYVDIESLNAYQIMLDEGKSQEEAFSIIQRNLETILEYQCNGMIVRMQVFLKALHG